MNTPYLYTVTMNTSSAGLSVHVSIFSTYDKAIEEMMKQQKEVCSWHDIDYETVQEQSEQNKLYWHEYSEETKGEAEWHYYTEEDDFYITIKPLPQTDVDPISLLP